MTAVPAGAAAICADLEILASLCPETVPRTRYGLAGPPVGLDVDYASGGYARCFARTDGRCAGAAFHLEGGIPIDNPGRDRPPRFVHLALYAAEQGLRRELPFRLPCNGPNVGGRADRLLTEPRRAAACLGGAELAGRSGTLALAPPFPAGGEVGGHLLFFWAEDGVSYAATLHAWRPVEQTVRVLGEVLASAP